MQPITLRLAADRALTFAIDVQGGAVSVLVDAPLRLDVVDAAAVLPSFDEENEGGSRIRVDAHAQGDPLPRFLRINAEGHACTGSAAWVAVLDRQTGLLWSAENVGSERLAHATAEKACAEFRLLGHSDWRLPSRAELLTLVDDTRHDPAIDIAFFPTCRSGWYWTSTPAAWSPADCAWIVLFSYGYAYSLHRSSDAFVRAVRSVGAPVGQ